MDTLLSGMQLALDFGVIFYICFGVFVGVLIGPIPGLSAPMAIALAVPLTYHLSPVAAIGFLIGINKGGFFGGSISSVLLNAPGTPEAAATAQDGYPLSQKGKGVKAIKMALYASTFGDIFSTILLIIVAQPIASLALGMGASEICSIIVLALVTIAVLEAGNLIKGILAAAFGLLLSCVGMDPVIAEPRLTFNLYQLEAGIALVPMCIGLLALSELFIQCESLWKHEDGECTDIAALTVSKNKEDNRVSFKEFCSTIKTLFRSSLIGSGIGALPGLGAAIASFLSYGIAKKRSKKPEEFGNGSLEGIAASESANNAVIGSALIPLFTLGIPGNMASALLIGAFVMHGVTPGPLMFEQHGDLVYGVYTSMIIGCIALIIIGMQGILLFGKLLCAPKNILMPIILFICLMGAYMSENNVFSVYIMIVFGIIGYIIKKMNFSFVCLVVGFILGPAFEMSFQQTFITFFYSPELLLERPVTLIVLGITVLFVGSQLILQRKRQC